MFALFKVLLTFVLFHLFIIIPGFLLSRTKHFHKVGLRLLAMSIFGDKLTVRYCRLPCPGTECGNWTCSKYCCSKK